MTVKELKELVSKIPDEYNDLPIVIDDKNYNEYCMGNGYELADNIDTYKTIYHISSALGDMDVYYFGLY